MGQRESFAAGKIRKKTKRLKRLEKEVSVETFSNTVVKVRSFGKTSADVSRYPTRIYFSIHVPFFDTIIRSLLFLEFGSLCSRH